MDILEITEKELSVEAVMSLVVKANCGAVSLFVGTTRDNFEGKQVVSLFYEAYKKMAMKEMEKICADIRAKWNEVVNIAIYHRLGEVKITEASVIIAISSPHRIDSLEAVHYAITALKTSVPIWKKEIYVESAGEWKRNSECLWKNDKEFSDISSKIN